MQKFPEKKWMLAALSIIGFIFVLFAFLTEIPAGGADNYAHFNIARWAFRYPNLFLDHWGKPVFTILSAPFAQLGFSFVRIFNTICGLLTGWYAYKLAALLKLKYAWFAALIAIFTPIYFVMMSSGMTEIIFSLLLIVSVYHFFKENYIYSAVLISFLFLARTEGFAFLLLFIIGFIAKKQYRAIPFLLSGFLLFSLIGWIYYYHDFFWLINNRPYAIGGETVYGRGNWYHFFVKMPDYFGYVITVLLLAGTIILALDWVAGKQKSKNPYFLVIILVLGTFWGYFFIHSYLWWKGETSAGLQRVMAAVSPMVGIIGTIAINGLYKFIKSKNTTRLVIAILSGYIVFAAFHFYFFTVSRDLSTEVLKRTTAWLKESGSLKYKLVMHNPYFAFSTEIDAWDTNVLQYGFSNNDTPAEGLPDSTLFIWDAHFSANEGRLAYEKIMENPNFELINYFEPEASFKVLGNNDYRILIFRKISNTAKNNYFELDKLRKEPIENEIYFSGIYNFQQKYSDETMESRRFRTERDSSNWAYSLLDTEFSPAFVVQEEKIEKNTTNRIHISMDICSSEIFSKNRLLMVCSSEKNSKSVHYEALDIAEQIEEINVWSKTEFIFKVPDNFPEGGIIKLYIWNIDKGNVLIDNFKFDIAKRTN